jgi:hypothetical protein
MARTVSPEDALPLCDGWGLPGRRRQTLPLDARECAAEKTVTRRTKLDV